MKGSSFALAAALADRVRKNPAAQLNAQETAKIEERLGKVFSPLVLSRVMPLLEPDRKPPEVQ